MKKVGIITFHRAMNCGAMLQAFALQKELSTKYEVEIIDYRCNKIEHTYGYKKSVYVVLKEIAKLILKPIPTVKVFFRRKKFMLFLHEYLHTSKKYNSANIHEANSEFDAIVAGSDQIWNPRWSGCDWNYFLEFADNSKKFSYAASFGGNFIDEKYRDRIIKDLISFNSLLLRESSGYDFASQIQGNIQIMDITCDPVFLLSQEEWMNLLPIKKLDSNYILIYFAAAQTHSVEIAKHISEKTRKKVIYFNSFFTKNLDKTFVNVIPAGPIEFLSYIKYADLVITTSFHAMAFSLIFNVPFYYELGNTVNNNNSRLEYLAHILDVENRKIENIEYQDTVELDWKNINNKMEKLCQYSKKILFDSLIGIDDE